MKQSHILADSPFHLHTAKEKTEEIKAFFPVSIATQSITLCVISVEKLMNATCK